MATAQDVEDLRQKNLAIVLGKDYVAPTKKSKANNTDRDALRKSNYDVIMGVSDTGSKGVPVSEAAISGRPEKPIMPPGTLESEYNKSGGSKAQSESVSRENS